jgi:hypothetical protein
VSTVAEGRRGTDGTAERSGRADAAAARRPDGPPTGAARECLREELQAGGNAGEASRQRRKLPRGCWVCGQLGHNLAICQAADAMVSQGTLSPEGLRDLKQRRGRDQ